MQWKTHYEFCILIPCYNNYDGLIRSLQSVQYAFDKYYVLVVDDGSVMPVTTNEMREHLPKDMQVYVLRKEINQGITKALNDGLQWIDARNDVEYIARLDCGDTCSANRFERQLDFLKSSPGVALLGSWCLFRQPANGAAYTYRTPSYHADIVKKMYYKNLFIHPTIIFRLTTVKALGFYPENFEYAEDYALCWMLINKGETHIIPEVLLFSELNTSGISMKNRRKQLLARYHVVKKIAPHTIRKIGTFLRLLTLFLLPNKVNLWLKLLRK